MLPLRPFRRNEADNAGEFTAPKRTKYHRPVREPLGEPADRMNTLRLIRAAERFGAQAQRLETDVAIKRSVRRQEAANLD